MWLAPPDVFIHWATYCPNNVAVQVNGVNVTYSELTSRAFGVAAQLAEQISSKTNRPRCAIISKSKLEFLVAAYGAMFARCSIVVVNPNLPERDLEQLLINTATKHLVCDTNTAE